MDQSVYLALRLRTCVPVILTHILDFENYSVRNDPKSFRKLLNKDKLPWTAYLGVLGMPGTSPLVAIPLNVVTDLI